jgi:siroheme synthase
MRVKSKGTVYLVGAGPGDAGLLTLRGAELLRRAEVVISDVLVNPALLRLAPPSAEIHFARQPQARRRPHPGTAHRGACIARAREGKCVVRLKGGDPFIFGRGGEEAEAARGGENPI